MSVIVDEVMLREPNLLIPGKAPNGPVRFSTDFGKIPYATVLYRSSPYIVEGKGVAANYVGTDGLIGTGGNQGKIMGGSTNGYANQVFNALNLDYGAVVLHYTNLSDVSHSTYGRLVESSDFYMVKFNSSSILRILLGASAYNHPDCEPVWTDGPHVLVHSWGGGNLNRDRSVFVDGVLLNTVNLFYATPTDASIDVPSQTNLGNKAVNYHSFTVFDQLMSISECIELSKDPYQFLIPA